MANDDGAQPEAAGADDGVGLPSSGAIRCGAPAARMSVASAADASSGPVDVTASGSAGWRWTAGRMGSPGRPGAGPDPANGPADPCGS